tara:strand:+ start:471 stop:1016 length:546 start_codon:yes stop_codon:yes gene_type:complete
MSTLKVGTIQDHANSNTAMSIDSTGRVLTPARPAFRVSKTNQDQTTTDNQTDKITFNNVDFDIGNNIGTTDKFIAPIAGIYHFDACARIKPTSDNAAFLFGQLSLRKNNILLAMLNQIQIHRSGLSGAEVHFDTSNLSGGITVSLAASDEIEVFVNINATNPEVKSSTDGSVTWFSGFLVG